MQMTQLPRYTTRTTVRLRLQKKRMQALLARPEFQALVESAPDALVMIDEQGRIALVNHQTEKLFGYSRQELLGQELECLLPERFRTLHLHHRHSYLQTPGTRPMGVGLDLYGRRKDGSEFPVDITLSPLHSRAGLFILSSIRDITERRRLEQVARAHQALLQVMLDALPSGIYLAQGEQARLVFANRAATRLWGASWRLGQPMEDFLRGNRIRVLDSDGQELSYDKLATVRALHSGQPVQQYQEVIQHPDGSTLPVLFNAVVLPADLFQHLEVADQGAGVLVVLQDIAPLKATEQLKDEFIGMAAHELRNPLTALKGFVEMLLVQSQRGRGWPLVDWQQEALTEIAVATDRLLELMEALLDVTRIQAGQLVLALAPCDLVPLTRKVVRQIQNTTVHHTIRLQTELESLEVSIDALRIEQVLTNLLHNAVKYSPAGGMIEVTIRIDREQRLVVLHVQDHGLGIPADQQQRLFQRFARAQNTQGITGAGLGLYLCRELIERHGGRIWFESVEGQGSTFFIELPHIWEPYLTV